MKRILFKKKYLFLLALIILTLPLFLLKTNSLKQNLVLDFSEAASGIFEFCQNNKDWRRCFGTQLGEFNKTHTLNQTLITLKGIQAKDPRTKDCHFIAHFISSSEVEKAPEKWLDVFNLVDQQSCNNGYVHGVMEGRSKFDPNFEIKASVIPEACQSIEDRINQRLGKSSGADDACAHIMGHIILTSFNGDINKAVSDCSTVSKGYKISCYQGIFMENILRENLISHEISKPLPKDEASALEIEKICPTFDIDAKGACYRELSHIYTLISKDPKANFDFCQASPQKNEAAECYFHALNLLVLNAGVPEKHWQLYCSFYSQNDPNLKTCISRVIQPLLGSSLDYMSIASNFCQHQEGIFQEYCFERIGQRLKSVKDKKKVAELCHNVPMEYQKACQSF